jgi:hypothetical protein
VRGDFTTEKDPKVSGFTEPRELGPRGVAKEGELEGRIEGGHNVALAGIELRASTDSEPVEPREGSTNGTKVTRAKGQVISIGELEEVRGAIGAEAAEEGFVAKNEEEGGEGAALLNTAENIDPELARATHTGSDLDATQKVPDQVDEGAREAHLGDNTDDPVVINRVESLLQVKGEDIVLPPRRGIESIVEARR